VPSVPDTSGFEARPGPLGVACATGRRVTRMPHFSHPAIRRIAIDGRPACANVRNSLVDRREHREQLHWQHGRVAHAREVLDDPLVPDGRFGYPFEISQSAARAATVRRCRAARVRRSPTSCRPRGPLWDDWRRRARRERALERLSHRADEAVEIHRGSQRHQLIRRHEAAHRTSGPTPCGGGISAGASIIA
jgi:hypothetical protein